LSLFLGVDGGGTKTAFLLLDSAGTVVARTVLPSSYYFNDSIELVERIVADGVALTCRAASIEPGDIDYAFFGLPGYGEVSADQATLDALPAAALGHNRYASGNDMVCGWAGSLGAADGINVVGGTGSMTYGERHGRGIRVGGWGELFGDEGSAYWIGTCGLNAFSRMSDGRLERGPLYDHIRLFAQLEGDLDLIDVVFNDWKKDRTRIAALSVTVAAAAESGDRVAADILARAGEELASLADVTRERLGFEREDVVPVSYSGGVFKAEAIRISFADSLERMHPGYDLRAPLFGPEVGAALYAAKLSGQPLGTGALRKLQGS
jgi:N-acetylglucosamine kinase-like BadF-type ATPase